MTVLVLSCSYDSLREKRVEAFFKSSYKSAIVVSEVKYECSRTVRREAFKRADKLVGSVLLKACDLDVADIASEHFRLDCFDLYSTADELVIRCLSVAMYRELYRRALSSAHRVHALVEAGFLDVELIYPRDEVSDFKAGIGGRRILEHLGYPHVAARVLSKSKSKTYKLAGILIFLGEVFGFGEVARILVTDAGNIALHDAVTEFLLVDIAEIVVSDVTVEHLKRAVFLRLLVNVHNLLVEALKREKGRENKRYSYRNGNKAQRQTKAYFLIHIIIAFLCENAVYNKTRAELNSALFVIIDFSKPVKDIHSRGGQLFRR